MHFVQEAVRVTAQRQDKKRRYNYHNILSYMIKGKHKDEQGLKKPVRPHTFQSGERV